MMMEINSSFFVQMRNVILYTPLLLVLQAFRALLWAVFALPMIMMLSHRQWIGALMTAVFLAFLMNIQHIIPNPFIPADARLVHFIETASANFILGVFLFWLLHRDHQLFSDLFGLSGSGKRQTTGEAMT